MWWSSRVVMLVGFWCLGFGGLAIDLVNSAWIVVLLMVVVFDVLGRG